MVQRIRRFILMRLANHYEKRGKFDLAAFLVDVMQHMEKKR